MDQMLGEVRIFAGNFAPRGWAFCAGQLLAISQNSALFSLLGTTYGGDGRTTFGLPDLRGRAPIGVGQGPGLTNRLWGQRSGGETHTMNITELPTHTHAAVFQSTGGAQGTAVGTTTVTPIAVGDAGNTEDPTDGYPAVHEPAGEQAFSNSTDSHVNMAPLHGTFSGQVSLDDIQGTITVGNTGGNYPFNIMQPWLSMYYIIAVQGVYPSRN